MRKRLVKVPPRDREHPREYDGHYSTKRVLSLGGLKLHPVPTLMLQSDISKKHALYFRYRASSTVIALGKSVQVALGSEAVKRASWTAFFWNCHLCVTSRVASLPNRVTVKSTNWHIPVLVQVFMHPCMTKKSAAL